MSTEIISRKLLQTNKGKISDKYDLENITSFFIKMKKSLILLILHQIKEIGLNII